MPNQSNDRTKIDYPIPSDEALVFGYVAIGTLALLALTVDGTASRLLIVIFACICAWKLYNCHKLYRLKRLEYRYAQLNDLITDDNPRYSPSMKSFEPEMEAIGREVDLLRTERLRNFKRF